MSAYLHLRMKAKQAQEQATVARVAWLQSLNEYMAVASQATTEAKLDVACAAQAKALKATTLAFEAEAKAKALEATTLVAREMAFVASAAEDAEVWEDARVALAFAVERDQGLRELVVDGWGDAAARAAVHHFCERWGGGVEGRGRVGRGRSGSDVEC